MNKTQHTTKEYLKLLFNKDEMVCFGHSPYCTSSFNVSMEGVKHVPHYVTLNPLKGTRADANVASFRNILIEMDKCSLRKQMSLLDGLKVPYSSLVYSGGKSYHAIISIEGDGLDNRQTYDRYVRAVYEAIDPEELYIDQACKNPSRFTRLGGAIRPDNGDLQDILSLGRRITKEELDTWLYGKLGLHRYYELIIDDGAMQKRIDEHRRIIAQLNEPELKTKKSKWWFVSKRAKDFLTNNITVKTNSWRNDAFYSCCELARCGYNLDEIYNELYKVDGYLLDDSESIPYEAYMVVEHLGELGAKLDGDIM